MSAALSFDGLRCGSSQVWGAVRLVPLFRDAPRADLRLARRAYEQAPQAVVIKGAPDDPKLAYFAYIPHAYILRWTGDGAEVSWGADLDKASAPARERRATVLHRLVKREGNHTARLLPMHLAMEGFLTLHFNGPDIAWPGYSRAVLRHGLSPRIEWVLPGRAVPDLEDALRVFERAPDQVGVLVFVGDSLASAFVTPHPGDYATLHDSLIHDFYGDLLVWYATAHPQPPAFTVHLDGAAVRDLATLRAELDRQTAAYADFHAFMASGLAGRDLELRPVRRCGPFQLDSFLTAFEEEAPDAGEQHIGERIVDAEGRLLYLKTFRLGRGQIRRVRILKHLAACDWNLEHAKARWRGGGRLDTRMKAEGLGYLLAPR